MRVEVRSRVPGADRDVMPDVLLELESERVTVEELIRRAVAEQVRLLRIDQARCRRTLDRQYLSADEIRAQAATGVVKLREVDIEREVARAHQAFERNVFAIFVNGRQVERLDEEIALRLGEPVVFLRLTPLVGG